MSLRQLSVLQWVGLLAGGLVFAGVHVVGFGITQAECGTGFGIENDTWQAALLGAAVALVLLAEAAAVAVLLRTRRGTYEEAPPDGRIRFFAIAAAVANVIFLMIVVLDGVAALASVTCRQS